MTGPDNKATGDSAVLDADKAQPGADADFVADRNRSFLSRLYTGTGAFEIVGPVTRASSALLNRTPPGRNQIISVRGNCVVTFHPATPPPCPPNLKADRQRGSRSAQERPRGWMIV